MSYIFSLLQLLLRWCTIGNMAKKKVFSTSIDLNCIKALKHLAVDTDKSLGRLLEEAIRDLVEKYEKQQENE